MEYQLTMTTSAGVLTLFECDYSKQMANTIFEQGHYKSGISNHAFVELITPDGKIHGSAIDRWVEKQIPGRTEKVIQNERFQETRLGKFLLKYNIISPWYIDYQKHKNTDKYAL